MRAPRWCSNGKRILPESVVTKQRKERTRTLNLRFSKKGKFDGEKTFGGEAIAGGESCTGVGVRGSLCGSS